jgi:hypothetical protein
MFPSRSSLPALTAFARPGPGASRSPTSSLLFGHRTPSTSSAPALTGRPPVFPWASLPRVDACSACRTALAVTPADRASVPVGASEAGRRSPVARFFPEEGRGPPRLLGCPPCIRAAVQHPAGPPRARLYRSTEMLRSGGRSPSAPEHRPFRDCNPAARILACLRFNRPITGAAARLATGLLARLWPGGV